MVPAVEHFRLDFVELPKLLSTYPGQPGHQGHQGHQAHQDRLHLWAEFFMKATQPEASEGLMSDPIIKKTFDKLKEISAMDEAQQIARARELGMLRISMELDEARDAGREEGAQKAQAAMIRRFMDGGMSLDQIGAVIKMTKEELQSLLSVE